MSRPTDQAVGTAPIVPQARAGTEARDVPQVDAVPAPAPDATVTGSTGRTLWRRCRWLLVGLAAVVLVALAIGVAQTRSVGGRLDPRAADQTGSRALATLLGERGVQVRRTTDPGGLADGADDRTVVFVPFPDLLTEEALRPLSELDEGTVLLIGPSADTLDPVTDDVEFAGTAAVEVRDPDCSEPAAGAAGAATMGGDLYRTGDGASCYAVGDENGARAPMVVGSTRGGARLVVIGAGAPLTNRALADDGNAALALNLLGADGSADEVRWLVPAPGSAAGEGSGTLSDILPGWVLPAALQLLLAGLLLALWRG
ncbi:MAG TPA: DUF4350 domain-containing protein, partial [Mycobacteriales bacterium]|nr:DUF4350 domain-containing protein [Mycobacteriales bacterium]